MGVLAYMQTRPRGGGKGRGRRAIGRLATIPGPTKGWNARDALDGMDPGYATILDNWFPTRDGVKVRNGSASHATGIGTGVVESLMEYSSGGTRRLLAFGNSAVYNATSAGAVGAALASGLTNNRWSGTMSGTNLIACNGADGVYVYNGSTFVTGGPSSGPTNSTLVAVHNFKERLFFIQDNSASFWYPDTVQAITGTFTEFPLGQVHPSGGKLMAIGTLTIDGGLGIDDLAVFVMESGAVLIYSGTDPSDDTSWSLVGIFQLGAPIGRRCLLKVGADLVMITVDGYIPLTSTLRLGQGRSDKTVSDLISPAVNEAAMLYKGNYGWQPILYPGGQKMIFNVPLVTGSQFHQHVYNTATGAWCRFKGWNGVCFGLYNDDLYFGGVDGKVYKADTGQADAGSDIVADGQTAWQSFGSPGAIKHFNLYRPMLASDSDLTVNIGLGVDFETDVNVSETSSTGSTGSTWDVDAWDVGAWAGSEVNRVQWQSPNAEGTTAAIRVKTSTSAQGVTWYSTQVRYEVGTGI